MSRPSPAARQVLATLEAQSPNHASPTAASVSLPRHYQTASSLLNQARTYQREGSAEHAYILYRRFVVYNIQTLHKHPHYNLNRWATERAQYRKLCAEAMDQLECIREEIVAKYQHVDEEQKDEDEMQNQDEYEEAQQPAATEPFHEQQSQQQQQPVMSMQSTAADKELEARMMALVMEEQQQKEIEKKEDSTYSEQLPTAYRAAEPPDHSLLATAYSMQLPLPPLPTEPSAPPLEEQDAVNGTTPPTSLTTDASDAENEPLIDNPVMPVADKTKWANLRLPVRPPPPAQLSPTPAPAPKAQPAVPTRPAAVMNTPPSAAPLPRSVGVGVPVPHSSVPYSASPAIALRPSPTPSAITPPHTQLRAAAALAPLPMPPATAVPQPQPARSTYRPSLRSLTSPALRPLHVPSSLMSAFMSYAAANTAASIETCAVLCGRLQQNRLLVTHCLIPTQQATASTCSTVDEMELLAVQTKLDLLTLGWIHTHPSQSCFLSSIDLHTQYGYQCMMAEAVAIVMAPTDGARPSGVFSLSPAGMSTLSACDRTGFHEHDTSVGGSLYGTATHVVRDDRTQVTFMDLRRSGPSRPSGAGVGGSGGAVRPASVAPAGVKSSAGLNDMYRPIPGPAPVQPNVYPHQHPHSHPPPVARAHAAPPPLHDLKKSGVDCTI